jgi:hypothetical protein
MPSFTRKQTPSTTCSRRCQNVEKRPGAAGVGAGSAHSEPSRFLVSARERSQPASLWLQQHAAISTCACLHRAASLRTRSHDAHLHSDVQQCFSAQHHAESSSPIHAMLWFQSDPVVFSSHCRHIHYCHLGPDHTSG